MSSPSQIVRNMKAFFAGEGTLSKHASESLLLASIAFSFSFALLLLLWILWFVYVVCSTSSKLKRLPYASSRFQQLCYRFFLFDQVMVVLFVIAVEAVPLINFCIAYVKNPKCVLSDTGVDTVSLRS